MRRTFVYWFALSLITSMPGLAREIALPEETASFRAYPVPGSNLVRQHCLACHSADYVMSQPSDSTRDYWEHTIAKMRTAFGAPIPDAAIPLMVEYLVKNYGAELP